MTDTDNTIRELETMHQGIYNECQQTIYYPPKEYQESSCRILNAATILYNEAICVLRNRAECGVKTKLSLNQICELMQKMCDVLKKTIIVPEKEDEIKKLFKEVHLNPGNFLVLDEWEDKFLERVNV